MMVDVVYFNDGISNPSFSVFVPYHSFNSSVYLSQRLPCIISRIHQHILTHSGCLDSKVQVFEVWECLVNVQAHVLYMLYLLHVDKKRFPIIFPFYGQLTGMREFITRQLDRHLKTVGVQVAEVIHTYKYKNRSHASLLYCDAFSQ